jgi:predicted  nucleic acid-binding Zn-ribbon protein
MVVVKDHTGAMHTRCAECGGSFTDCEDAILRGRKNGTVLAFHETCNDADSAPWDWSALVFTVRGNVDECLELPVSAVASS